MKKIANVVRGAIGYPLIIIVWLLGMIQTVLSFVAITILSGYKEAINTVKEAVKQNEKEKTALSI